MTELVPETVCTDPDVLMFTAPNPGPKTLDGTHTFLIGQKDAYVIDPGPDLPDYQSALHDWLQLHKVSVSAVLLTHSHPDHAPGSAALAQMLGTRIMATVDMDDGVAAALCVDDRFRPGDAFPVAGDGLAVVPTPGHVSDHVSFFLEQARILFAGDTILGAGTTLIAPPEGDMVDYMHSLETLRALDPVLIAPGHGPLIHDPQAKIREYVGHRQQRERQLLEALRQGPANTDELVQRVYVDVDPKLHGLARGSVEAQLDKLLREGHITRSDDQFKLM